MRIVTKRLMSDVLETSCIQCARCHLLQANEWSDAVESVLDWLPLAEDNLVFRSMPHNEHDLEQFLDNHTVRSAANIAQLVGK